MDNNYVKTRINSRPCKRCFITEIAEIAEESSLRDNISELIRLMPEEKRTPPPLFSARFKTCLSCEHLIKNTCVKCGCYAELRAAKLFMDCPVNKWNNT